LQDSRWDTHSPVAVGTVAVVLVAVWARLAWAALPWAAERQRDRSAEAPLPELWEVDRQAPAVRPAMEQREPAIPL
jgi:hypothetical protein